MRVSVSDVDAYEYFLNSEDMTMDALLARLRRETPPTENMLAGTALHKFLEHTGPTELGEHEVDGFTFRFECDACLAIPPIRELKATGSYTINGVPITLVGKVDALSGIHYYDHKLTSRFDAEKYANAFQWRAYLVLMDGWKFTYNVFTATQQDGVWVIRGFDPLTLYRYPGIDRGVESRLTRFVDFVKHHMPEKLEAA